MASRGVALHTCALRLVAAALFLVHFSVFRLVEKLVEICVRRKKLQSKQRRNGGDIASQSRQCWVESEGERREKCVCVFFLVVYTLPL